MARQISCPGCRAEFKLPDSAQGKTFKVTCKKCGAAFVVKGGAGASKTGVQGKAPKPAPPRAPKSGVLASKAQTPVLRRPVSVPRRKKKSPVGLILVLLLLLLGGGAAVGGYFLFLQPRPTPPPMAQAKTNDKQPPAKTDNEEPPVQPKVDPSNTAPLKTDPVPPKTDPTPPKTDPEPPKTDPLPPKVDPAPPVKNGPKSPLVVKLEAGAKAIAIAAPGKTAVIGMDEKRQVVVVDLATGNTTKTIPVSDVSMEAFALFTDGNRVAVGGEGGVRIVALDSGSTAALPGTKESVAMLAVSRDCSLLATGEWKFTGTRGIIQVFSLKSGTVRFFKEQAHRNVFKGLALTSDNRYVISTGVDDGDAGSKVIVWDIAAGKETHVFTDYGGTAEDIAVSNDGKLVAAAINQGGAGGSVRVWDVASGAERFTALGKAGEKGAAHVVFGPEDKTVIATFYDASTRVFDLQKGTELGGVRGHTIAPNVLAISPTGRKLISADFSEMKVWDFPESLEELAKPDQPFVEIALLSKTEVNPATKPEEEPKTKPTPPAQVETKAFKNATVKQDAKMATLSLPDEKPLRVTFDPKRTKAFDQTGKPVFALHVLRDGNVVDGVLDVNGDEAFLAEVRLVRVAGEAPGLDPPGPKSVKETIVAKVKVGVNTTWGLILPDKSSIPVAADIKTKGFDGGGQPVKFAVKLLQEGNKVDVVYVAAGEVNKLLEIRLVQDTGATAGAVKKYQSLKVTDIGGNNIYTMKKGFTNIKAIVNNKTTSYDIAGNPVGIDQVLRLGEFVDVTVEERPNNVAIMIEVRGGREK